MPFRTGIGQDSHAFDEEGKSGKPLILGGVVFENEAPLKAHSDGDVISHAIFNAVAGALAKGDIGSHYPDTDPKCKNLGWDFFLTKAREMVEKENYVLSHVDVMIEAKKPKLAEKNNQMRENIARELGVKIESVSIKATTGEGLTAFGQGKGIQVFAVVTLVHKNTHDALREHLKKK